MEFLFWGQEGMVSFLRETKESVKAWGFFIGKVMLLPPFLEDKSNEISKINQQVFFHKNLLMQLHIVANTFESANSYFFKCKYQLNTKDLILRFPSSALSWNNYWAKKIVLEIPYSAGDFLSLLFLLGGGIDQNKTLWSVVVPSPREPPIQDFKTPIMEEKSWLLFRLNRAIGNK